MTTYTIEGTRNPRIILSENNSTYSIQTIGDPHLGRHFRNNSKHRLGDREQSIKDSFITLLNSKDNLVIIMGDLLDKVVITNEWFWFVRETLQQIATQNPNVEYIILNGNHDEVKDRERRSSFTLLKDYFISTCIDNLSFVDEEIIYLGIPKLKTQLVFTAYDPFNSIDELYPTVALAPKYLNIVFGHFEVESFGSDKFIDREIPQLFLKGEVDTLIVTGHIHKPSLTKVNNIPVLITGSMQPYAFGEEVVEDGLLYVNTTIDEVTLNLNEDPNYYENSNVRIHYNKGESFLDAFNCYSLTYKMNPLEKTEVVVPEQFTNQSFTSLFLNALHGLTTEENQLFSSNIEAVFREGTYESN